MDHNPESFIDSRDGDIQVIIVSQVCLFRECVRHAIFDDEAIRVLDSVATFDHALASVESLNPDMVLLDFRFPRGATVAAQLNKAARNAQIVAMALEESEEHVVDWAEAGIAGYVADTASTRDFSGLLRQIRWGRQICTSHVMGGLLRRIRRIGLEGGSLAITPSPRLTPRERVIQHHLGEGLSNKEIARQLNITVGTTKSHVHNILAKLNLTNRTQVAVRLCGMRGAVD